MPPLVGFRYFPYGEEEYKKPDAWYIDDGEICGVKFNPVIS